jgi:hypothetical protein
MLYRGRPLFGLRSRVEVNSWMFKRDDGFVGASVDESALTNLVFKYRPCLSPVLC